MKDILQEEGFSFISNEDKAFIRAFDGEMNKLGYDFGDQIGSGYCWGKYMMIYTKSGAKSKKVYARIYIRDDSVVLRLFFSDIDQHRAYIERAPLHIKDVFAGEHGACQHCRSEEGGGCRFRKTYSLDGQRIEKMQRGRL